MLFRSLDGLPEERRSELDPLLNAWQTAHAGARTGMLDLLDSKAHAQFKKEFARFLGTAGAGAPPESDVPLPDRVREAVPLLVVGSYAAVRAYEGRVEGRDTPLPRLHQLRIAAKRLRYTLEFFREILPTEVEALIDRIKELQEHLGNLQDAVVTCGILRDFLTWGTWGDHRAETAAAPGVVVAPGVATYLSVRQAELQRLVKGFPAVWEKVSGEDFRRQVFAVVTGL